MIYVSVDPDPEAPKRVTKDVPWLRMTFNDNSDFASLVKPADQAKIVEIEDVERGEDFIQAGVRLFPWPLTSPVLTSGNRAWR